MERKRKTLLLSILTLCICMVLVVGGTFALFTDEATVNNHLQAGNLKVGLYRTAYTEKVLVAEGYLDEKFVQSQDNVINGSDINLTDEDEEWLFSVNNAVPQSYYKADLDVVNNGSVAFNYGMQIMLKSGDTTDLVDQIQITVTYGDSQVKSFVLSDCANNKVDLGVLTTGQSGRFTVKAEFIDDTAVNNNAMNETVEFFVQVYATQRVSAPVVE